MGNKCCSSYTKKKICNIKPDTDNEKDSQHHKADTGRKLNTDYKTKRSEQFPDMPRIITRVAESDQNLINENPNIYQKAEDKNPASPSSSSISSNKVMNLNSNIHQSKSLHVPMSWNSNENQQNGNGNLSNSRQQLEVPRLKPSPTAGIQISKEWIDDNYQRAKSRQSLDIGEGFAFGQEAKQDPQVIRKLSTIHQISEKSNGNHKQSYVSHQNSLPQHPLQGDLIQEKLAKSEKRTKFSARTKKSVTTEMVKNHDTVTSQKSSNEDDLQSEENIFSRANSLQQDVSKSGTLRSQGTARFRIQPLAYSSQNSMTPLENGGKVSLGFREGAPSLSFKTGQFNHDSFARNTSNGSNLKDMEENVKLMDQNILGHSSTQIIFNKSITPNNIEFESENHEVNFSPSATNKLTIQIPKYEKADSQKMIIQENNQFQEIIISKKDSCVSLQDLIVQSQEYRRDSKSLYASSILNIPSQNIPELEEEYQLTSNEIEKNNQQEKLQLAQNAKKVNNFTLTLSSLPLQNMESISQQSEQRVAKGLFETIKEERETPSTKKHKDTNYDEFNYAFEILSQPKIPLNFYRAQTLEKSPNDGLIQSISPIQKTSSQIITFPSIQTSSGSSNLARNKDLLKPIKQLQKRFTSEQVEAIVTQKRENNLRMELEKIKRKYGEDDSSKQSSNNNNNQLNTMREFLSTNFQTTQENELPRSSSAGFHKVNKMPQQASLKIKDIQSPYLKKNQTSDNSPLCDTIEISEDFLLPGVNITDDGGSDNGNTPISDMRVSQFGKSDNSVNYSIIDVQYEDLNNLEPPPLMMNKISRSENIQDHQKIQDQIDPLNNNNNHNQELLKIKSGDNVFTKNNQQRASMTTDSLSPFRCEENNQPRFSGQMTKSIVSVKQNGKKKINQYIILKTIGEGKYGKVKLALDTTQNNKPYAIKVLKKTKFNHQFGKPRQVNHDIMQEVAIMKKLDHENVVKLYEVLDDPTVDKLYIVMEYIKHGSLMNKIMRSKTLQPLALWKYFRDLISGLQYLHECAGVIHRDIKPENLLIDENDKIKITDFGESYIVQAGGAEDMIESTAGSNYFFAPEICSGQAYKGKKSDIWAAGVTLYYIMFKKYPFTSNMITVLQQKIKTQEPEYPPDANVQLVDLLKKIFIKDPEKRITIPEIIQHDWITSNGIQPLTIHFSPPIQLNVQDKESAISKIHLIAKIKLRIRAKLQTKRLTNKSSGSPLVNKLNQQASQIINS